MYDYERKIAQLEAEIYALVQERRKLESEVARLKRKANMLIDHLESEGYSGWEKDREQS